MIPGLTPDAARTVIGLVTSWLRFGDDPLLFQA